ncbi:hypothetical protein GCM10009547_15980 [Sporichthya brevicatena]|uniref:HTH tetR-type domain-containing protein n=1 Tax=Sporichthya brevicatena TaxID=171442 RepID=A0ABN1GN10_9ACTN
MIRAGMELFATGTPDEIPVADIARSAGVTTAALYYHFKSKEQILLEGFRAFGTRLVERFAAELDPTTGPAIDLGPAIARLVVWLDECDPDATVFFVSSVAAHHEVEEARRATRHQLVPILGAAAARANAELSPARSLIVGASVLGVYETAVTSWIERDEIYRGLGRRGFLAEVEHLVERMLRGG